jgi:anaerobic magnesium-protoporphyrin IX monomethyl ester cyclase
MKVVFIEPRSSRTNVYSMLHMPLLGPVYLGTILKNRGHQVEIYNEDMLMPDYAKLEADLVGISILTSTASRGYEIAKKFPREKVIIGGVHASLLPQEASQHARQVVVGEAEEVITGIAEGSIKDPIVYAKPIQDLDSLPQPDFSLIKGYKLASALVPISTSRGCPFDCSFCSVTKMFGRKFRFRSAENVVEELRLRNAKQIFFCDDNFTAYPKRTRDLMELMLKNKIRSWACQVRCDVAKSKDMLGLMARSGCKLVCIGFESINRKTLEAYDKKQSVEDIIHAIHSFHKKKIKIHGMFVLGSDNDDRQTVWDTFKFAVKQKIDTIQMSILTPFPGTKINQELETQKRIFSRDWSLYDGQHIVFRPKLLGAKELQINVVNAYLKFYSLSRSFTLLFKLRLRNAVFHFMGHSIIKRWVSSNRKMSWLAVFDSG